MTVGGQNIDALPPDPVFRETASRFRSHHRNPGPVFTLGRIRFEATPADSIRQTTSLRPAARPIRPSSSRPARGGRGPEGGRAAARAAYRTSAVADQRTNTVDVVISAEAACRAVGTVTVAGTTPSIRSRRWSIRRLNTGRAFRRKNLPRPPTGCASSACSPAFQSGRKELPRTGPSDDHRGLGRQAPLFRRGARFLPPNGFGLQGYSGHRNLRAGPIR